MKIRINERYSWNPFKLMKSIITLIMIILLVWMIVSYGEILIKNTDLNGYSAYTNWNFWRIVGGW